MSRLKDALDKAAGQADSVASRGSQYTHPPHVVPDVWGFEAIEPAVPVQPHPAAESREAAAPPRPYTEVPLAPEPAANNAPPLVGEPAAASVTPAPHLDLWANYRFGAKALGKVVVGPTPNHGLIEQYRRLGAALHHHQLQTSARTVMVTSAVASEGKTLTATNLALTLSHSYQRRVLLVDADLRRPSVHDLLSLSNESGLSDNLRSPELTTLAYHTVSPTLCVLTAGRPDSDPMAGLVSKTMERILADAAQQFDWVIVDTPPVALLPDANLLAAMIDTAILIVSANSTPHPLVKRAMDAIGEQRVLGVVLNRMAAAEIIATYNYRYYGYGYGYNYGRQRRSGRRLLFWRRKPTDAATGASAPVS